VLQGFSGPITLHGPFVGLDLASERAEERRAAVLRLHRAIEVAAELRTGHLVIHPYPSKPADPAGERERLALESLLELSEAASRLAVLLVVENMVDPSRAVDGFERYLALVEPLPASAGALVDVGHVHASGWDVAEALRRVGDHLKAVHLHDNAGQSDDHRPVGEGSIRWETVWPVLRAAPADCHWVTEYIDVTDGVLRAHLPMLLRERVGDR
jgi:sugar phosphate isomerase/epimerase